MSDPQANKAVVSRFIDVFSSGDVPALIAMMTDDSTWWVSGRIDGLSGTYPRDEFARLVEGAKAAYKTGALKITPSGMVAEGDKVAVEAESWAETVDGRVYNNYYHWLVTVRDGKIAAVKEYMDTMHAKQTFIDPA
jgi:ketosteroid isomerase-like protein